MIEVIGRWVVFICLGAVVLLFGLSFVVGIWDEWRKEKHRDNTRFR